jgi:hypothetical protein
MTATQPLLASVRLGPIATGIGSTVQAGPIITALGAGSELGQLGVEVDGQLADIQSRLSAAEQRLEAAHERVRAGGLWRLRAPRARVRSLRRQAAQRAALVQQQAIAQARSTEGGAWVVVSGAGVVLAQSGDVKVSHLGTGAYRVSFDGARCLLADSQVHVTGPDGPADGGFFLAVAC